MQLVKIRRVGNSNVVTLPREFESVGYSEGRTVAVARTSSGDLLLVPESRLREYIQDLGRQVIDEDREALAMLAAYDRGELRESPQEDLNG